MATTRRVTETADQPKRYYATGRRKEASARVWLTAGSGRITVNGRDVQDYLCRAVLANVVKQPLDIVERGETYDVVATVRGGGLTGQAGALRHGISRALTVADGELRPPLKAAGLLTRDARAKERKKYGQRGARARFQFSKR
jgi:small subunit ribosomal protein S9